MTTTKILLLQQQQQRRILLKGIVRNQQRQQQQRALFVAPLSLYQQQQQQQQQHQKKNVSNWSGSFQQLRIPNNAFSSSTTLPTKTTEFVVSTPPLLSSRRNMTTITTMEDGKKKEKEEEMKRLEENEDKNWDDFNQLIVGYAETDNVAKAQELLLQLEQPADLKSYTAVMDGWLQHQSNLISKLSSFTKQEQQEEGPNYKEREDVISNIVQAAEHVDSILTNMEQLSMTTELHHYNSAILAFTKCTSFVNDNDDDTAVTLLSKARGTPQRAQRILEKLESFSSSSSSSSAVLAPSIDSYNLVIKAWGTSSEHHFATMAQRLYDRLLHDSSSSSYNVDAASGTKHTTVTPNLQTHQILLRAWCRSDNRHGGAAHCATKVLSQIQYRMEHAKNRVDFWNKKKNQEEEEEENFEATIEDYVMVLECWSHSRIKNAAVRALSILQKMEDLYMSRVSNLRPTFECYKQVLLAMSKSNMTTITSSTARTTSSSNNNNNDNNDTSNDIIKNETKRLGEAVLKLLHDMEERQIQPDSECYGAAIKTWSNSALIKHRHNKNTRKRRKGTIIDDENDPSYDAKKAYELLQTMNEEYHKSSTVVVKPTRDNYNDVIQAWSVCDLDEASERTEELLSEMEKRSSCEKEGHTMAPNKESYVWTIDSYARRRRSSGESLGGGNDNKVEKAVELLQRMMDQYENGNVSARPDIDVFNAVVNVCAKCYARDEKIRRNAFRVAIETVQQMREQEQEEGEEENGGMNGCKPDAKTYRLLLEACRNLLPAEGGEREKAVEAVFNRCCLEGLVDRDVLEAFRKIATPDLYRKRVLLIGAGSGGGVASSSSSFKERTLPEKWTRNLRYRVQTREKGKAAPKLSIDGRFVNTPEMNDYKMRNLRHRRNQRLLRGGRTQT